MVLQQAMPKLPWEKGIGEGLLVWPPLPISEVALPCFSVPRSAQVQPMGTELEECKSLTASTPVGNRGPNKGPWVFLIPVCVYQSQTQNLRAQRCVSAHVPQRDKVGALEFDSPGLESQPPCLLDFRP